MKITDWIMGKDMDFEDTVKKEEPPHVDPVIEQRRKEKFSEPMIYNEEKKLKNKKVEAKVRSKEKEEPKSFLKARICHESDHLSNERRYELHNLSYVPVVKKK